MKIVCLVKFVPDVDNFIYDYEKNILVRENVKLILNPDDACALAYALKIKEKDPDTYVEIVSMAPVSVKPYMEDLLRRRADRAVLISDRAFSGSDTYATSIIIGKYLVDQAYDCILTGTHSMDGDTAHIPAQIAELLHVGHMSGVIKIHEDEFHKEAAIVEVDHEESVDKFRLKLPAVIGVRKESKYKLPFVKYKDLDLDVTDRLQIITNKELCLNENEIGLSGSKTKVSRTYIKQLEKKEKLVLGNDDASIEQVYQFLKDKGFVR